jgi:hypothetical protein
MLFSTTYLRSRVFLSIKSPFFMFLRFNGSKKLPQKGLLGSVGLRTVAPATPLNREVLPSSYSRPKIESRSGLFSTQENKTCLNALQEYNSKNIRNYAIKVTPEELTNLRGSKKEGHHDHTVLSVSGDHDFQLPDGSISTKPFPPCYGVGTTAFHVYKDGRKLQTLCIHKTNNLKMHPSGKGQMLVSETYEKKANDVLTAVKDPMDPVILQDMVACTEILAKNEHLPKMEQEAREDWEKNNKS